MDDERLAPKSSEEADDWERHGYAHMKPRPEMHLILLAAWCGVSLAKLPKHPTFRSYPNSHAEAAWTRVADAAEAALRARYRLIPKEGPEWEAAAERALDAFWDTPEDSAGWKGGIRAMEAALRAAGGESDA